MEFLFADYTQKTEALVTGVRLQNEAFGIYELQLLGFLQLYQQWNSDNIGYRIARTVACKRAVVSKWDCRAADKDSFQFGDAERTSPGGYFAEVEQQRRRIEYRWMKGMNVMFYLTYNYTNAR